MEAPLPAWAASRGHLAVERGPVVIGWCRLPPVICGVPPEAQTDPHRRVAEHTEEVMNP